MEVCYMYRQTGSSLLTYLVLANCLNVRLPVWHTLLAVLPDLVNDMYSARLAVPGS